MENIKISLDKQHFSQKPSGAFIAVISNRIANEDTILNSNESVNSFIQGVGTRGQTFCPATFKDNKRCKENFEQQQLFALDFDNKDENHMVQFDEIKDRAEYYGLPILFAYETFSSVKKEKFRVVFLNDVSITDRPVAEAMQCALSEIFPEADTSCINDVSKMYFGGSHSQCLYYDKSIPKMNIDDLFRGLTSYERKTKGDKHYLEKLKRISGKTGVALNSKGLFDITVTDEPHFTARLTEEQSGAINTVENENGGNSPSPNYIIYNIKGNGENPPLFYQIKFNVNSNGTRNSSVSRISSKNPAANHKLYRSNVINELPNCRLYKEFVSGIRKLSHDELFHILNNMINVETGASKFLSIIERYPELYDAKRSRWKEYVDYNIKQGYRPSNCSTFCPYRDTCEHEKNILSTVHRHSIRMERIDGCCEKYYPLSEVEQDTYNAINKAFFSCDNKIHVIKAQTAIGKSSSFLRIMEENPNKKVLVAVPTNLLKEELLQKAKRQGIQIKMTPSLESIMDELPFEIGCKINQLYACGQGKKVHRYISKVLETEDISCLKEYMNKRKKLGEYKGNLITTHRYLLSMDKERLDKFDCIIIDEDIIFKSIISNQGEVKASELKQLKHTISDLSIRKKISDLLNQSRTQACIYSNGFEWDYKNDENKKFQIDIPAFCSAEYFYFRNSAEDPSIDGDTFSFIKPVSLLADRKYIIVSATADESIYCTFFGDERIDFHECKQARYKGELCQYYKKSMSRSCIEKNPNIVSDIQKRLGVDENHVITFKNQNIGELHFGNTEGSNMLEGEDIVVIGTPYHADFLYKLVAFSLGIDFDEDEKAEMQVIEHNGYRTQFTTFKNQDLREIQFWMLESELEQAVGRARLLRRICKVHLFSNFPLRQADMIKDFQL